MSSSDASPAVSRDTFSIGTLPSGPVSDLLAQAMELVPRPAGAIAGDRPRGRGRRRQRPGAGVRTDLPGVRVLPPVRPQHGYRPAHAGASRDGAPGRSRWPVSRPRRLGVRARQPGALRRSPRTRPREPEHGAHPGRRRAGGLGARDDGQHLPRTRSDDGSPSSTASTPSDCLLASTTQAARPERTPSWAAPSATSGGWTRRWRTMRPRFAWRASKARNSVRGPRPR